MSEGVGVRISMSEYYNTLCYQLSYIHYLK